MAALTGCIHTNAHIYFDISDVLSCSENITECVYINFVSLKSRAERLIASALILQYEKTRFFNRRGCDYILSRESKEVCLT